MPIAVFVKKGTNEILVDPEVNHRIGEAFDAEGADAWFMEGASDRFLLPNYDPNDFEKVDDVLDVCHRDGLAFIPWYPLARGALAQEESPLARIAARRGVTPAQIALAWLLRRSPVMLPIPGTSSPDHLEENVAAAEIELADDELAALDEFRAS